ncbi:hypothetical protein A9G22_00985 [Gilliamella sp. App2-1]|nr:hypothetical protein A9G22_00985 [Gilliamella apicola]OCG23072.1 hypothetical protein A9G23_00155 [Gilliamella apicola]
MYKIAKAIAQCRKYSNILNPTVSNINSLHRTKSDLIANKKSSGNALILFEFLFFLFFNKDHLLM